jgi:hypothetical protein
MYHYGAKTPKRHLAFSNSSAISEFSQGRLRGWKKLKSGAPVRHYVNSAGRKCYVGTKYLKKTGRCSYFLGRNLVGVRM